MPLPDRPGGDARGGELKRFIFVEQTRFSVGKMLRITAEPEKLRRAGAAARGSYSAYRSSSLLQEAMVTILTGAGVEVSAAILE